MLIKLKILVLVTLTTFQVLNTHLCLVATILDSTNMEPFHSGLDHTSTLYH